MALIEVIYYEKVISVIATTNIKAGDRVFVKDGEAKADLTPPLSNLSGTLPINSGKYYEKELCPKCSGSLYYECLVFDADGRDVADNLVCNCCKSIFREQ